MFYRLKKKKISKNNTQSYDLIQLNFRKLLFNLDYFLLITNFDIFFIADIHGDIIHSVI